MLVTQSHPDSATPWTVPARLLCPWNSSGKNTGVDSHSLLQGIFLTQGSNPGFLHCREILHSQSHQGSPSYYHFHLLFENHIWHPTTVCYFANLFRTGTLVAQWLRLFSQHWGQVQCLVRERDTPMWQPRVHMLQLKIPHATTKAWHS